MVSFRLVGGDRFVRRIGIAARPDEAVQNDGLCIPREFVAQLGNEGDGVVGRPAKIVFRRTKILGPVHVGFPGLSVENETGAGVVGEREKSAVISGQSRSPLGVWKQRVGGKLGNIDAVVEDQVGLEAGVHEKQIAG